jgi:hypothetical protein
MAPEVAPEFAANSSTDLVRQRQRHQQDRTSGGNRFGAGRFGFCSEVISAAIAARS